MLIKLLFEFTRFFMLHNVIKIEFVSQHARGGGGGGGAGCSGVFFFFFLTGRQAYNWVEGRGGPISPAVIDQKSSNCSNR